MKPFPVGGAIFDLDGVLVDTACDHFEAWQQMARSLGFELSPVQGEWLKGVSRHEALDIVLSSGTCRPAKAAVRSSRPRRIPGT
jgi:beta-phosphoglucomutase